MWWIFLSKITFLPILAFYEKAFNSCEEQVLQGPLNTNVWVRGFQGFSSSRDALGKTS